MKVQLTVTHREKPRLGWACWDAGWLIVEAFYSGLSLARGNWLQLGISGVFTVLFLVLMLWHVRATTWDEYSVSRWIVMRTRLMAEPPEDDDRVCSICGEPLNWRGECPNWRDHYDDLYGPDWRWDET